MPPPLLTLSRFVEEVRAVASPGGGALQSVRLPDGRTTLIFRALRGGSRGDVWVAGPRTRALFKHKSGLSRVFTLLVRPGWSVPLFGVATRELTDRIVPLEELWGGAARGLCEELLATRSRAEVMERVEAALARRPGAALDSASGRLARRAVQLLESGEVRVDAVAGQLGVTARHLRRAFVEQIGIGPKEFARSVRLQRAVRLAAGTADWTRVAADAGYYDQAHLIAEFHRLVGLTPSAFLRCARAAV
jgi:AraC-like DNA-binding protein